MLHPINGGEGIMQELTYDKLLTVAVVIVLLAGAYNTIMSAIKNKREEKKLKEGPLNELKATVAQHTTCLANDKKRLDDVEEDITTTKAEITLVLKATRALLSHGINGNSIETMKENAQEIDNFLISRK